MMRTERRGFTLIELLTVIAITALLMTIIIVPVYQSFNLTRSAQAFGNAQDRAHVLADRIAREIGNAVSVRSTSSFVQSTLNGNPTNVPAHALIIVVPKMGSATSNTVGSIEVVLPYTKMDLVVPAEGDVPANPGQYTNPNVSVPNPPNGFVGFVDPTLQSPKGQPTLPVGPGYTIIRYFVGLRDPFSPYNNPYDGLLMEINGSRDNLYVLYRAEVQPFVYRQGTGTNGDTTTKYRPNLAYFHSDAATDLQIVDFDDPRFFLADNTYANKTQVVQNWQSKAIVQTEVSRYDMIQPVYDKASRQVTYIGDAPRIVPLIQFQPTHVSNEPAQGQVAVRLGEETNNAATIGPDVFKTRYALWSNQVARVWPQGWSPAGPNSTGFQQYFVARTDASNGTPGGPPGYSIYYYDPNLSVTDYNSGQEVFDIYTYENLSMTQGRFPFSQAITAANNRSNWLATPLIVSRFTPFDMNSGKGKLTSSFDITEVGDPTKPVNPNNPQNLPSLAASPLGVGYPASPINDPNLTNNGTVLAGNFYDAPYYADPQHPNINELFNWTWINAPNMQNQIDRFIDLRVIPNGDGSVSPLHPTLGFPKCTIVPGSEIVYGPDQFIGPNFGNTVRYQRVTQTPGPNQYQINYVDQPEPRDPAPGGSPSTVIAGPIDYSLLGLTAAQLNAFNPAVYDPHNFVSAVIQPRYKKGYIKLYSDPNSPLPIGQFQIAYRFQFNGTQTTQQSLTQVVSPGPGTPSDVFAVDYDTRQLMSVLLTIRNYPQTTNIPNPQTVTLKATATVRNVIR